ncbi:MAG: hypothetical protein KC646_03940 [Candidatus Cloacimonetes bacterium]|nr:hypothetical protein [Candidatus Cloacimonadota bacterium]
MSVKIKQSDQEIKLLYNKALCAIFKNEEKEIFQVIQSMGTDKDITTMILKYDQVASSFYGFVNSNDFGDFDYFGLTDIDGNNYGLIRCNQKQALAISKAISKQIPDLPHQEIGEFSTTVVIDESSAIRILIGVPVGIILIILMAFSIGPLYHALPSSLIGIIEKLYNNLWLLYFIIPFAFMGINYLINKDFDQ